MSEAIPQLILLYSWQTFRKDREIRGEEHVRNSRKVYVSVVEAIEMQ